MTTSPRTMPCRVIETGLTNERLARPSGAGQSAVPCQIRPENKSTAHCVVLSVDSRV